MKIQLKEMLLTLVSQVKCWSDIGSSRAATTYANALLQELKLATSGSILSVSKVYRQAQMYGIVIEENTNQMEGLMCIKFDRRRDLIR